MGTCPNNKYVINETFPDKDFIFACFLEFRLQVSNENVGIGRGHLCAHSCALLLEIEFTIKLKNIVFEDYIY